MGFFVILFTLAVMSKNASAGGAGQGGGAGGAASSPDDAWLDTVLEIRGAFNNPVSPYSTAVNEQMLVQHLRRKLGMTDVTDEGQSGRDHEVKSLQATPYFALSGLVTFTEGSAELDQAAEQALTQIAQNLAGYRLIVAVRGHASEAEAAKSDDRGLRLSFDRAMKVANRLQQAGIEWARLRIVSCGDSEKSGDEGIDEHRAVVEERVVQVIQTEETLP